MNKRLIRYLVILFAYVAVLYPVWERSKTLTWSSDLLLPNLFPFFGLIAFSILWLHSMSGVFEVWLRKNFDFDKFVHWTSLMVFVSIILHPLLLFISIDFNISGLISNGGKYIRWGVIGWFLLITYDIGKALKRYNFFVRHWNKILLISTIGFLFTFFHSINLGSDLQSGPLRAIWIFYGTTAIIATIWTYGIKKLLK